MEHKMTKCKCAACGKLGYGRKAKDSPLLYPQKHMIKGTSQTCLGSYLEAKRVPSDD